MFGVESSVTRGYTGEPGTRKRGTSLRILYLETRNREITEIAGDKLHTGNDVRRLDSTKTLGTLRTYKGEETKEQTR